MMMIRALSRLSLFVLILISQFSLHAQVQWSGIIAPTRAINWANAGAGTIPTRTTICSTIAPLGSSGSPVSPSAINSAIASCASGSVVYLSAGSFYLNGAIDFAGHSNVTLRGAGADQTKLYFSGSDGCLDGFDAGICLEASENSYPGGTNNTTSANFTAGYSQGSTSITLSTTSNLAVGRTIILDQCDDGFSGSGAAGGTAGCSTGSATDTGQVWNCSTEGVCASNTPGGAGRTNRSQQQQVLVTGISGSTVTISPGLYLSNWRSSQSPGAFWPNANSPLTSSGVESLSIDMTASTGSQSTGILLGLCYDCWVVGTRTVNTIRNHIWIYQSSHCTVANNYMYGTQNSTDESYGIEHYLGSDNLIINNIAQHIVSPTIANGADEGNVYAYNFAIDDYFSTSAGWFMPSYWTHAAATGMDLFEGNQGSGFISDNDHGTHNLETYFRNFGTGNQASCYGVACGNQLAAIDSHFSRYFNIIGNVFGSSTYTNYSSYPTSTTEASGTGTGTTIYVVGWSGNNNTYTAGNGLNDFPLGAASQMLWGNYDTVSAAVRWNAAEVPSGLSDTTGTPSIYAAPIPASQSLPPSFFLPSSRPSWWATPWGTPAWPPIGPDVTGGNITGTGGHANNIPAELCYANTPADTAFQQTYPVTAAKWSSGTATLAVATDSITQGEITVSSVTPAAYNGTYQITASTSSSVSYALASNPGTFTSGGSVLYPNIRLFNASKCYGQSTGTPATQPQPPTALNGTVTPN
jgi:hypothetical protein